MQLIIILLMNNDIIKNENEVYFVDRSIKGFNKLYRYLGTFSFVPSINISSSRFFNLTVIEKQLLSLIK